MCQWPYEYRFYDECGLTTHDVHVILGIQQLAVLLGPYLVAWLGSRKALGLRPKATATLCLLATALACEIKRAGLCWESCLVVGFGPSVAASLLDIKDHVLVIRHLQVYASMLVWAVTGLLVDVYGWGVEWVYSLASVLYVTALLVVLLGVDGRNDMEPSILPCIDVVASSFAAVAQMSGTKATLMSACGTSICMSAFASAFRYTAPARPEFCAGHAFLSFGTTLATAGNFTPPRHRSALAGKS
ncbi:hypothetical protein HPB51_026253 [Rhipicephalus microplus]|uniref:Uncharacterized protein n=1 Tax=Rhipicephalus microplus TaxID=6941 RepID=A0A9J6D828_RHIMP|nr:hypothetical protein HPB51_026253 [Rhipicephalus microplus]